MPQQLTLVKQKLNEKIWLKKYPIVFKLGVFCLFVCIVFFFFVFLFFFFVFCFFFVFVLKKVGNTPKFGAFGCRIK